MGSVVDLVSSHVFLFILSGLSNHLLRAEMASKKLLVVFGATGAQGGSVAKAVLADPKMRESWAVRGITRDTSKPPAKELKELGAEVVSVSLSFWSFNISCGGWVARAQHWTGGKDKEKTTNQNPFQADLNDPSTLKPALEGAYAVYAVTNYWEKADANVEMQQGKAIADEAKVYSSRNMQCLRSS